MRIVRFLDGKKTLIGAIAAFVLYGLLGTGMIDQSHFDLLANGVEFILGVGLVHKMVKSANAQ